MIVFSILNINKIKRPIIILAQTFKHIARCEQQIQFKWFDIFYFFAMLSGFVFAYALVIAVKNVCGVYCIVCSCVLYHERIVFFTNSIVLIIRKK